MKALGKSGNAVTLDAPFYQAGLAGYSDAAMRLVARRHGCPYCITEAMLDLFLVNGGKGLKEAELDDQDHPIAGQLMGSHPADIAKGAVVLAGLGYDVIDVNLACPVKKIKKKCRGGHLLSVPEEAIDILDAVRQAVPSEVPTTVKLRRGFDDSAESEANFCRIFEAAIGLGYAGATVHGRSVEQKYIGASRWGSLEKIVATYAADAPEFVIGGSGDIWEAADIFRMLEETGVDWVSVARGCIGNPWIFAQARAMMAGDWEGGKRAPSIGAQRGVLLEHFDLSVALHGEARASRMMRKFGIKFSRHHPDGEAVKAGFISVKSVRDWREILDRHYSAEEMVVGGA